MAALVRPDADAGPLNGDDRGKLTPMVGAMINFLLGCRHHRITRPITPVPKRGAPPNETYVACLDCGRRLHYDLTTMRIGKPLPAADPVM